MALETITFIVVPGLQSDPTLIRLLVLYYIVLYCTVLYCTVLYCTGPIHHPCFSPVSRCPLAPTFTSRWPGLTFWGHGGRAPDLRSRCAFSPHESGDLTGPTPHRICKQIKQTKQLTNNTQQAAS